MNKRCKSVLILALLACLLISVIVPAFADETQSTDANISISNIDDFLEFSKNCILDSYSENLTVSLDADLDLSDHKFQPISIFNGTFLGNNHKITGIALDAQGSVQGFFRYLGENATVSDLTISGSIQPTGSRNTVGGVVGSNKGKIINCHFEGEVSGSENIGGIAGVNQVSGIIENSGTSGIIHGSHFVGGTAGENQGLIRGCRNDAEINAEATQNSIALSDINTSTILGTESANTVTDVGGIAGTTTGVIRNCNNYGTVGYQHMGYNIGGIAGSQKGFLTECTNYAQISGRKDVGGIVGQMEPITKIEFTEDTLQILQQQLASTSALANQASSNAHNNVQNINSQVSALRGDAETAMNAVEQLIPSPENPHLPDADSLLAAKNTLTSSIGDMQGTMDTISVSAKDGMTSLSNDIQAITNQIQSMSQVLGNASETLGGRITDISDTDTPDDLTGKVSLCANHGPVMGDLNIGGIVGAVSWENDLDPEDSLQITGNHSMNFDSELRAVILDSSNSAPVSAKKKNVGGIVGQALLGLMKGCVNTGRLDAENAEFVGGITGSSDGFIRSCAAKCELFGERYVGGIAGSASLVTDCLSLTDIRDGSEKLGCILGTGEQLDTSVTSPATNNFYLDIGEAIGGIDGIDYSGVAQSLSIDEFLSHSALPEEFRESTVSFRFENGNVETISIPLGEAFDPAKMPILPSKEGYVARWSAAEDTDMEHIYFDMIREAEYLPNKTVIASDVLRDDGAPLLLAEGQFDQIDRIHLESTEIPDLAEERKTPLEAWALPHLIETGSIRLHLALPASLAANHAAIMVLGADETWNSVAAQTDGSYLVFSVDSDAKAICLLETDANDGIWLLIVISASLILLTVIIIVISVKKKKRRKNEKNKK